MDNAEKLNDHDLEELCKLAKTVMSENGSHWVRNSYIVTDGTDVNIVDEDNSGEFISLAIAKFVAKANPSNVLKLVEEINDLKKQRDDLNELIVNAHRALTEFANREKENAKS